MTGKDLLEEGMERLARFFKISSKSLGDFKTDRRNGF